MWNEWSDDEGFEYSGSSAHSELLVDELVDEGLDFIPARVDRDQSALGAPLHKLIALANKFLQ